MLYDPSTSSVAVGEQSGGEPADELASPHSDEEGVDGRWSEGEPGAGDDDSYGGRFGGRCSTARRSECGAM
eukprot:6003791-Prymnesium_polylepis.1